MLDYRQTIIRLLIAAIAGSVIGFERERLQWAAGLRTHMLVSVGSCLVMIADRLRALPFVINVDGR